MREPGLVRELVLRGGLTLVLAAIAALWLDAGPWIWAVPAGVVALVALKWLARPGADDDDAPD
mgnify:FL=1|jgi:hypothetical protein